VSKRASLLFLLSLVFLVVPEAHGRRRAVAHPRLETVAAYTYGGYADRDSVIQGETIAFHIATSVSPFDAQIVNLATGAVVATIPNLTSTLQDCTGLFESGCGWPVTATVRASWPSGFYAVRFPTAEGDSHIFFAVRSASPGSVSPILIVSATHTSQAYNSYGNKSVYPSASPERAFRVSLNRPYHDFDGIGRFRRWEQPFVQWMAQENRAFEAATDSDLEDPTLLGRYNLVVFVGHSEYWTHTARANLEAYTAAGGHVAVFGGNTMWWQARLEQQGRKLIVYKSALADPEYGRNNPVVTVNWFAEPVNRPENLILGSSFRHGGFVNDDVPPDSPARVGFTVVDPSNWVFAGAGVANGTQFGKLAAGEEVDGVLFNCNPDGTVTPDGSDGTPLNFHVLATIPATAGYGVIGHYTNAAGGMVFNAGTQEWSHGLAGDVVVQTATRNVLDRLSGGVPQLYDPVAANARMRELFNCPLPAAGVIPGWRGSEGDLAITPRCAWEGAGGAELAGTRDILISRNVAPTMNLMSDVHLRFYLNADAYLGPLEDDFELLTLQRRVGGVNTRFARLDVMTTASGKALRLNQFGNDGNRTAATDWIPLGTGWKSVQVHWRSPGDVTLQIGDGALHTIPNPAAGQAVNEVVLFYPKDETSSRGHLCLDALAVGEQPLPPLAPIR
jgi:hypothetical protein